MSLKNQILDILDKTDKDHDVYDLVKYALRHYKREKNRLRYDLQSNYSEVVPNRHQLSESIIVKGLKSEAIYRRLYMYETTGFKPENENKAFTKKVCLALKCKREDLITGDFS